MAYVECGTAKARKGSKAWGRIPVREGRKQVALAVCVVNGAREGEHVESARQAQGREASFS